MAGSATILVHSGGRLAQSKICKIAADTLAKFTAVVHESFSLIYFMPSASSGFDHCRTFQVIPLTKPAVSSVVNDYYVYTSAGQWRMQTNPDPDSVLRSQGEKSETIGLESP